MPIEHIETQSYSGDTIIVNNYYNQPDSNEKRFEQSSSQGYRFDQANVGTSSYQAQPSKSKIVALLLCLFLGLFGAHRFYLGYIGLGIVYFFTLGFFGIGWLVDLVRLALGKMTDAHGLPIMD